MSRHLGQPAPCCVAERARLLVFVRALISEATRPTGRRLDNRWLDEVVADLTPDPPSADRHDRWPEPPL